MLHRLTPRGWIWRLSVTPPTSMNAWRIRILTVRNALLGLPAANFLYSGGYIFFFPHCWYTLPINQRPTSTGGNIFQLWEGGMVLASVSSRYLLCRLLGAGLNPRSRVKSSGSPSLIDHVKFVEKTYIYMELFSPVTMQKGCKRLPQLVDSLTNMARPRKCNEAVSPPWNIRKISTGNNP